MGTMLTRRDAIVGGAGLLAGGVSVGTAITTVRGSDRGEPAYPYWTEHFQITEFDARSEHDDIQAILGLKNIGDRRRVWTGVVWVANQVEYDQHNLHPAPQLDAGEELTIGPWVDGVPGKYEVRIVGTEHITTVEVKDNSR